MRTPGPGQQIVALACARRDLALLKTFGFTRRQLAATVAWQFSVAVATGVLVGVPLGIVAGRVLWDQFAPQIYAIPRPSVPSCSSSSSRPGQWCSPTS